MNGVKLVTKISLIILLSLGVLYNSSIKTTAAAKAPTFVTKPVTEISIRDARINATVKNPSKIKIEYVGFRLWDEEGILLDDDGDNLGKAWSEIGASFLMSNYFGKLQAGKTYMYQFYVVTNTNPEPYESDKFTFTTLAAQKPVITLKDVTDVTAENVRLNARISNPDRLSLNYLGFILYDNAGTQISIEGKGENANSNILNAYFNVNDYYSKLSSGITYRYRFFAYFDELDELIISDQGVFTTLSNTNVSNSTEILFPLSKDKVWFASTYAGHGENSGVAGGYSSVDIIYKNGGNPTGQNVFAVEDGVVESVLGHQVVIKHTKTLITTNGKEYNTWFSLYAHMTDVNLQRGEPVYQGQVIGKVGQEGNASGPHLHFTLISGNNGTTWGQSEDICKAISPYYVKGFVTEAGEDYPYCICDREGPAVTAKLINWIPTGK